MENKASAQEIITNMTNRINSKTAEIKDYSKLVQFDFVDTGIAYRIKITNGHVEKVEKSDKRQDADVTVACKVNVLQAILDNKLGATRALITRKISVDGPVLAIRELRQKVLGPEHNNLK